MDEYEPLGTAGLAVLDVLKAQEVVICAGVFTRYFGGILLGRGGLVRAYGGAAREALKAAGSVRMVPALEVGITVDYTLLGIVQNELLTQCGFLQDTEYLEKVTFHVLLLPEEREPLRQVIQELTAGDFLWREGQEVYRSLPLEAES